MTLFDRLQQNVVNLEKRVKLLEELIYYLEYGVESQRRMQASDDKTSLWRIIRQRRLEEELAKLKDV